MKVSNVDRFYSQNLSLQTTSAFGQLASDRPLGNSPHPTMKMRIIGVAALIDVSDMLVSIDLSIC